MSTEGPNGLGEALAKVSAGLGRVESHTLNHEEQLKELVKSNFAQAQALISINTTLVAIDRTIQKLEANLLAAATGKTHVPLSIFLVVTFGLLCVAFISLMSTSEKDLKITTSGIELISRVKPDAGFRDISH